MSEEAKIMKRLGQRLREIRMARQLSQEAYALSIEMDRTYYTAVESGRRNLSLGNLYKIAERKKLWAELRSTQAELATLSRALEESGNPLANMINQGGRFAAAVERVASTPGLEMIINLLQKSKEHGQRKESVSGEAGPGPDGATS